MHIRFDDEVPTYRPTYYYNPESRAFEIEHLKWLAFKAHQMVHKGRERLARFFARQAVREARGHHLIAEEVTS
jgi:hypothetical protein